MSKFENKTYVITSAQSHAEPNHKVLDTLESYADAHDAELIVLPMIGNAGNQDWGEDNFHPRLVELGLLYDARKLNNGIGVEQFHVKPWMIDPITGLNRFAQREQTLVFASPKQRWRHIPHSNWKTPKALITTGACTLPNYATGDDVSSERRRLGSIAIRDHEYGAIVIEVMNGRQFHWRNLMIQRNGKFTDLGVEYDGNDKAAVSPLAMACGDWHTGYTDRKVRRATLEMIAEEEPEVLVLHDFFNGHSVSHHYQKQLIYQMIREGADKGNLSLERELAMCGRELAAIAEVMGDRRIVLPAPNHHEFLDRYLDEGRFIKDAENARIALKLATAYADGLNPVEEGIRMVYGLPDNVTFLTRWDDLKVKGYQLGNHGDTGPGGGRGSIKSKEADFGKSISGHVHSSEKLRQTFTLGTMLPFNTFYIKGSPVRWTHSHAKIYNTGVQMVNIVGGSYSRAHAEAKR